MIQPGPQSRRVTENSGLEDRVAAEDLLKQRVAEAVAGEVVGSAGNITVSEICKLVLQDYELR